MRSQYTYQPPPLNRPSYDALHWYGTADWFDVYQNVDNQGFSTMAGKSLSAIFTASNDATNLSTFYIYDVELDVSIIYN